MDRNAVFQRATIHNNLTNRDELHMGTCFGITANMNQDVMVSLVRILPRMTTPIGGARTSRILSSRRLYMAAA